MARLTSQLILSLIDRVTSPARRVAQSVRGITRAVGEANGQRLRAVAEANRKNIGRLRSDLVDAGGTAFALALALRKPISAAREFESVLTDIGQKADLSRKQQLQLGAAIRALGPQVNRSATELAGGVDVLAGFGLDPQKAVAMMRPIGRAATAYKAEIQDLARASFAVVDNLKIPFGETGRAIDVMAQAGKEGAFELKDMAQYFPSLTAAAQALGQTGAPAVADLAAALQITRKGAGDSAEAATNLQNVLQKMRAPATRRAFAKMGVDLEASLAAASKQGLTPIEAIAEITNRTLKGDLSKIADLFEDAQVQKGLRPLIQNLEEYRRIRERAGKASGVVDKDFAARMQNAEARTAAFKAQVENLAISFGTALMPGVTAFLGVVGPLINGVAQFAERFPLLTRVIVGTVAAVIALRLATVAFKFGKAQMLQGLIDLGLGLIKFRTLATGIAGSLSLTFRGLLAATGIGLLILAAGWIVQHWSGVSSFFRGFGQGFMAAIAPVRPALEPLIQGVKTVVGWVRQLLGGGGEDWSAWGVKAGTAVGNFVTGAVRMIGTLIGWFKQAIKIAMDLAKWTPAGLVVQGVQMAARAASGRRPAGKRELGGDVLAGQSYLVGERRAEIFTPDRSGRIDQVGAGSPGQATGGRGGVLAPRISIVASGANAQEVAQLVMDRLRSEYARYTAGAHSDAAGVFS